MSKVKQPSSKACGLLKAFDHTTSEAVALDDSVRLIPDDSIFLLAMMKSRMDDSKNEAIKKGCLMQTPFSKSLGSV